MQNAALKGPVASLVTLPLPTATRHDRAGPFTGHGSLMLSWWWLKRLACCSTCCDGTKSRDCISCVGLVHCLVDVVCWKLLPFHLCAGPVNWLKYWLTACSLKKEAQSGLICVSCCSLLVVCCGSMSMTTAYSLPFAEHVTAVLLLSSNKKQRVGRACSWRALSPAVSEGHSAGESTYEEVMKDIGILTQAVGHV